MGYVSALFIRARHLMTMGETEREAANSVTWPKMDAGKMQVVTLVVQLAKRRDSKPYQ